jgi:micrococcal nuclease
MKLNSFFILIFAIMALPIALSAPDEASGVVTYVVDGDTLDIRINKTDPRIETTIERIRLADLDSPEMSTPEGALAKNFTAAILLNKTVWLDIDDKAEDGRDLNGRLVCVLYLTDLEGQPITSPCFNRILVDSDHAEMKDYWNEFNPSEWWPALDTSTVVIPGSVSTTSAAKRFIGSISSNRYHYTWCQWAERINEESAIWFSSSQDAKAQGYLPCGICDPP